MALPKLNLNRSESISTFAAVALEPFLNPLKRTKRDLETGNITDFSTKLLGIQILQPILRDLGNLLTNRKENKDASDTNDYISESVGNTEIAKILNEGLLSNNSILSKIFTILEEQLMFTKGSATKAARERADIDKRKYLKIQEENNLINNELNQTKLLEQISENIQPAQIKDGGLSKLDLLFLAFRKKIMGFVSTILKVTGITFALGLLKTGIMGAITGIKFLSKRLLILGALGIATGAFESVEEKRKRGKYSKDASDTNVRVSSFLGGEDSGFENAGKRAALLGTTGASIGGSIAGIPGALIGGGIGAVVGAVGGFIGGENISKSFSFIASVPKMISEGINSITMSIANSILDAFDFTTGLLGTVKQKTEEYWNNFLNLGANVTLFIRNKFNSFTETFSNFISNGIGAVRNIWKSTKNKFNNIIKSIKEFSIVDTIDSVFTSLKEVFTNMVSSLESYVIDILGSLGIAGEKTAKFIFGEEKVNKVLNPQSDKSSQINLNQIGEMFSKGKETVKNIIPTKKELVDNFKTLQAKAETLIIEQKQIALQKEQANRDNFKSDMKNIIAPITTNNTVVNTPAQITPMILSPRNVRNTRENR
jgi:hypothetical protein